MADRGDSLHIWLARALATYSLAVYAIGILLIVTTRLVQRGTFAFPGRMRQALVTATLLVMVVTYLSERRFSRDGASGSNDDSASEGTVDYSLSARLSMVGAAVGVAMGIYVAVGLDRMFLGGIFLLGAYLFVRMAYHRDEAEESGEA